MVRCKHPSARHLDGSPRLLKLNRFLETQMDHRVKEVIELLRSNPEREVPADKMALLLGLSVLDASVIGRGSVAIPQGTVGVAVNGAAGVTVVGEGARFGSGFVESGVGGSWWWR